MHKRSTFYLVNTLICTMHNTRQHNADIWLTEQFISSGKQSVSFFIHRDSIDETERIVRDWFKRNELRIYFKKEPKGAKYLITLTHANYA